MMRMCVTKRDGDVNIPQPGVSSDMPGHWCLAMARGPKPAGGHLILMGSTMGCVAPQTVPSAEQLSLVQQCHSLPVL